MNNLIVLPLLLPLLSAIILVFLRKQVAVQRSISGISALLNIVIAVILVGQIQSDGIQTLYMGGWIPPYGIVFVADMFAGLLILTASVVGARSEEHTSELQSRENLVCRLLLEK